MRGTGSNRSKLDSPFHEPFLNFTGEELPSPVRLDPLDGERHYFCNLFQEFKRIGCCSLGKKGHHFIASAIVYSRLLVKPFADFAGIHLHTIPRGGAGIPLELVPFPFQTNQWTDF